MARGERADIWRKRSFPGVRDEIRPDLRGRRPGASLRPLWGRISRGERGPAIMLEVSQILQSTSASTRSQEEGEAGSFPITSAPSSSFSTSFQRGPGEKVKIRSF